MRLVLVRHADAGDRDEFAKSGEPDSMRPLSQEGRDQMRDAAKGLRVLVRKCELIASSPYTRAVQTARIVSEEFAVSDIAKTSALEPEAPIDQIEAWLAEQSPADIAMLVGHEPHLGILTTWLISSREDSRVDMKKGGACLIEFDGHPARGKGVLLWLMGPKHLAAQGR